jgi:hypothetical protein
LLPWVQSSSHASSPLLSWVLPMSKCITLKLLSLALQVHHNHCPSELPVLSPNGLLKFRKWLNSKYLLCMKAGHGINEREGNPQDFLSTGQGRSSAIDWIGNVQRPMC